jgi:hypothetical protein
MLWSWRWPLALGKVTTVDVERNREKQTAKLAVAYEFTLAKTGHIQANASGDPLSLPKEELLRPGGAFDCANRCRYDTDQTTLALIFWMAVLGNS